MILNENLFEWDKEWIEDEKGNIIAVRSEGKELTLGQMIGDSKISGFDPETNSVFLTSDGIEERDYAIEDIIEALNEAIIDKKAMKNQRKFLHEDTYVNEQGSEEIPTKMFTIFAKRTSTYPGETSIHTYAVIIEAESEEEAKEIYKERVGEFPTTKFEILGIHPTTSDEIKDGINIIRKFNEAINSKGIVKEGDSLQEDINEDILDKAYNGSYYTIIGTGGDLQEWKDGYQNLLDKENIGTIKEWVTFTGKDMNKKYNLTGDNAYADDLTFLAFPLDNLNMNKLAIFKIKMRDRWFDDIVDNNKTHNECFDKKSFNSLKEVVEDESTLDELDKQAGFEAIKYKDHTIIKMHLDNITYGTTKLDPIDLFVIRKDDIIYDSEDIKKIASDLNINFDSFENGKKIIDITVNKYNMNESLESKEVIPETPEGEKNALASIIHNLLKDEFDAIQNYNDAVVNAEAEGFTDLASIFREIANDENKHVGNLEVALGIISDQAAISIPEGEQEAEEVVNNTNSAIEDNGDKS